MVFTSANLLVPFAWWLGFATGPIRPFRRVTQPAAVSLPRPDKYLGRPNLLAARRGAHRVELLWNAVPETETQGYTIERSSDGGHWAPVAYLACSLTHRYRYDDTTAAACYFRVARLDFSRHYTFSRPQLVHSARYSGPLVAHPNPAHGAVHLLSWDPAQPVELLDAHGEVVNQLSEPSFSTHNLLPGIYALRQGNQITRLVVR